MEIQEITPGCKVDIYIVQRMEKQDDISEEQAVFMSTVYDVNEDNTIEINMPIVGGALQMLPKHIRYEFAFTVGSKLYKMEGTITEHLKKGNIYLVKVEPKSALKKFQRREYFRIECLVPMMFSGIDEKAASHETMEELKEYMKEFGEMRVRGIGTILDISGGGARFVSTNSLQDIPLILMQFSLEHDEEKCEAEVIGKIVHSEKMPDDNKYIHRVKFFFKNERIKEKIIAYVFEEERRIRKKEQGL